MENKNTLDNFLREKMNPENLEVEIPNSFVELARTKVLVRKQKQKSDVIFNFFEFLNFKLKMSYAICVFLIGGFFILYFTNPSYNNNGQSVSTGEICDMLSVKNSTLLPGITTFIYN